MNDDEANQQSRTARKSQEHNAFAELEIQDYIENPLLINVLKIQADNAYATIARLTRAERTLRRDLDQVRQKLSDELVDHEKTRREAEATTARPQEKVSSLQDQAGELRRLSAVSVVVAWVGTVLVAIGVNLLTDGKQKALGLAIIIAGAVVGSAAFFVRRRAHTGRDLH
jgi:predicted TIM-barrel enzyme